MNLLTMMKGLPLAYNHDMQEDKEYPGKIFILNEQDDRDYAG